MQPWKYKNSADLAAILLPDLEETVLSVRVF